MAALYLALLHYPVYDKNGQIVTTSITNMDIHDISRSARTYGVTRFYVATPIKALRELAGRIVSHWMHGQGATYNSTRKEALQLVSLVPDLRTALQEIEIEEGRRPRMVATSARTSAPTVDFLELKRQLETADLPLLLLFGTGWGLTEETIELADDTLVPLKGVGGYNHLSVRAAAAIILDRLRGTEAEKTAANGIKESDKKGGGPAWAS